MNVIGFGADGIITELQIRNQNENFVAISKRFRQAIDLGYTLESDQILTQIISEISSSNNSDYEKLLLFQCQRELTKNKIQRGLFREAIPLLINSLKLDENRIDLWLDLATCAKEINNADVYRAAITKIKRIRPEFNFNLPKPTLPTLAIDKYEIGFVYYNLQQPCWRLFLSCLLISFQQNPYDIIQIIFATQNILPKPNPKKDFFKPSYLKKGSLNEIKKGKIILKIGGLSLIDFLWKLDVEEISSNTWLFSQPPSPLISSVLNKISELKFKEVCPNEISRLIIELGSIINLNDLTPGTKLFIAELASVHIPLKSSIFLSDIIHPQLHSPNALLRIAFAILDKSIRENRSYEELEKLLNACENHLKEPLALVHSGIIINLELLKEKKKQMEILKLIYIPNSCNLSLHPKEFFSNTNLLQFLSLSNLIQFFLQNEQECGIEVYPNLLKMISPLVRTYKNDSQILEKLFNKIIEPLSDECVNLLVSIFDSLTENGIDSQIKFSSALALARSSINYEKRAEILTKVHRQLGEACHLQGGKFLEYLLDALLKSNEGFETETSKAFTCYFSNVPLIQTNHGSTLKFRCSPFINKFYDHISKLDEKGSYYSTNLSLAYLEIWAHSKKTCNCINDYDGWKMYKIVKKKDINHFKLSFLPEGYTKNNIYEDLLRHDPLNRSESKLALTKLLIQNYYTQFSHYPSLSIEPGKTIETIYLKESLDLLNNIDDNDWALLLKSIILYLLKEDLNNVIEILLKIQPFNDNIKKESKRLYWIMRIMIELNQHYKAIDIANLAEKSQSLIPMEYFVHLVSYISEINKNDIILKKIIDSSGKNKPSPQPFLNYAKKLPSNEGFSIMNKLIKIGSTNLNNCFIFETKFPFLLYSPEDIFKFRNESLSLYIELAVESGNFDKIYPLFAPNNKKDRKISAVFKQSRFIFGVDRVWIFSRYLDGLTKKLESLNNDREYEHFLEVFVDALLKGYLINDNLLINKLENFKCLLWKRHTGSDAPEDSTIIELVNIIDEIEEEDIEEEDGDFVQEEEEEENDIIPEVEKDE